MNEIGREIFYNMFGSMQKRLYQFTFNDRKEVSTIHIIDASNINVQLYITSIRLNKLTKEGFVPVNNTDLNEDALVKYLHKITQLKGTIGEMFMPINSMEESDDIKCIVSPYAIVTFEKLVNVRPWDESLLLKITSGLDNLIGVCSVARRSDKVSLIPHVKEILYKKEDIVEYLI